ncbi:unnamed protein product [Didymodactylos carnosus]|uniref:EF-hand domain-containing protein n=1 Tax=Didymodactylos carnosus TaxID=1234261 RepID=A0A8S2KLN3_9BILA|nr:unnamed protein product [Didymodactylos carnosus]CAF3859252.1 unnamed protein product [Didymodactylos carnosus]
MEGSKHLSEKCAPPSDCVSFPHKAHSHKITTKTKLSFSWSPTFKKYITGITIKCNAAIVFLLYESISRDLKGINVTGELGGGYDASGLIDSRSYSSSSYGTGAGGVDAAFQFADINRDETLSHGEFRNFVGNNL